MDSFLNFYLHTGIGCGFGYVSTVAIIGKYFKKRFAIANSISSSGNALAIIVFPVLARFLNDIYNWNGTMLVFASIIANICAMGMLFRPVQQTSSRRGANKHAVSCDEQNNLENTSEVEGTHLQVNVNEQKSFFDDVNRNECINSTNLHGECYRNMSSRDSVTEVVDEEDVNLDGAANEETASFTPIPTSNAGYQQNAMIYDPLSDSVHMHGIIRKEERPREGLKHLKKSILDFVNGNGLHLIKTNFRFNLICLIQITNGIGYTSVMIHFVSSAVYAGIATVDAAFLLSIIGIGSLVGRLLSGPIINYNILKPVMCYFIVVFISGVSVILCPFILSFAGFVVFAAIFGVSSGMYKALNTVLIRLFVGADLLSTGVGIFMPYVGIGGIVGPIFVGKN